MGRRPRAHGVITLYQFPISHYCEKVRWALSYKRLEHRTVNLVPGLHFLRTRRLTGRTTVPIIDHDGVIVRESSVIISYLDETFPDRPLTPTAPELRAQALEWERFADEEIGVHVRRIAYQVLLDHPDIVIRFFTQQGPWYGRPVLRVIFPKLAQMMRKAMDINEAAARRSNESVGAAIDKLEAQRAATGFVVGDAFTRADLAAAALLAPFVTPAKYGLEWPPEMPEPLAGIVAPYRDRIAWVDACYARYR